MVNDKVKRARHLLGAAERRVQRIGKIADGGPGPGAVKAISEQARLAAADLAELHALSLDLVQTHGPGAGVTPDVMAAVVAPKEPKPDQS